MSHVIEMLIKGRNPSVEGRMFCRLHIAGGRGVVSTLDEATKMTLPEAWLVLGAIERNPTPGFSYWIAEAK